MTNENYWPDGDLGDDPDGDLAGYDGGYTESFDSVPHVEHWRDPK